MRHTNILLVCAGALVTALCAQALAMPPHIKARFELMTGNWQSITLWGDTKTISFCTTYASDDEGLVNDFTEFSSTGLTRGYETVRWDQDKNAIVYRGVTSRGAYWTVIYDKHSKDAWSGSGVGRWDGQPWESDAHVDWQYDSYRYEDVTQGKKFVIEGSRVKPLEVQAAVKGFADFMAGTWTREEDGVERCHDYKWILGGKFMQSQSLREVDGMPSFNGIIGVDTKTGQAAWWAHSSEGGSGVAYLVESGDDYWIFEGDFTGSEGIIHRRITGKRIGPTKLEAVVQDTVGGVTKPEVVREWTKK